MSCRTSIREEFRLINLRLCHHQPHRFVNAQYHQVHRVFYVIYRWVIACFLLAVSIVSGNQNGTGHYFIYLTHWTFISLTFSHVVRAGSALYYHVAHNETDTVVGEINEDRMPWYLKFLWVSFNVSGSPSLAVTIMYWGMVYTEDSTVDFVNFAVHGSNSIVVVLDQFVTGMPVRILHAHHPLIYAVLYSLFTGIYYAAGGTTAGGEKAIYAVLDYEKSPGLAVGLLLVASFIAIPLLHVLLFGLYQLRVFLYRKCCLGNAVKDSSPETGQNDNTMAVANPAFVPGDMC
ncbi:protein rolling stone-like [Liolophura sinensis]|uniref:protein rolling stone-like n=1 Tax=Liolophura sinensis TaxID=3198878 RepID=UPI003157F813